MKYKITNETMITDSGILLHRIECLTAFGNVKVGDKGGYIEKESNLSQLGNAWVCGNAKVYGDALVCGNALVCENAEVCGNAKVCENADYIVFKNWWSSGRYFTWTKSNNMWKVGCFYGTGEELIEKTYKDNEKSSRQYEKIVRYVQSILED